MGGTHRRTAGNTPAILVPDAMIVTPRATTNAGQMARAFSYCSLRRQTPSGVVSPSAGLPAGSVGIPRSSTTGPAGFPFLCRVSVEVVDVPEITVPVSRFPHSANPPTDHRLSTEHPLPQVVPGGQSVSTTIPAAQLERSPADGLLHLLTPDELQAAQGWRYAYGICGHERDRRPAGPATEPSGICGRAFTTRPSRHECRRRLAGRRPGADRRHGRHGPTSSPTEPEAASMKPTQHVPAAIRISEESHTGATQFIPYR